MNERKIPLESYLTVLLVALVLLQLTNVLYHMWPFTTDDAFISWHYAQSMANGRGLRWHASSPPVEGYSNFSWVLLATLFLKLGLPLIPAVKCFASLSLFAALAFLYQFARTFLSPLHAMLPVYLFSHYQGVSWWTVSGFETSFFIALVLLANWQIVSALGFSKLQNPPPLRKEPIYNAKAWLISCLSLTLLALTRFEGLLWYLVLLLFYFAGILAVNVHSLNDVVCLLFLPFASFFLTASILAGVLFILAASYLIAIAVKRLLAPMLFIWSMIIYTLPFLAYF